MLNREQKNVYDEITAVIDSNNGGVFFVYRYGGTWKTFLWKTLLATFRSKGMIIQNVASSYITFFIARWENNSLSISYSLVNN